MYTCTELLFMIWSNIYKKMHYIDNQIYILIILQQISCSIINFVSIFKDICVQI